jgi:hypothetical protein
MYVLHLSVDCQGCFFVRLVWRFKYMIDVQREYIYESQDCTTRYQYNRDRPALDDSTNFNSHLNRHSRTYEAV